ncbi:hypothetical protein PUN28_018514 [Cardiocondyla obscurior]|uniref:Gem-associated protein 8 n=1 Tax=Cardiocondyla obscurior TaxID=286306 RepID=A0AAW2EIB7_9HYME
MEFAATRRRGKLKKKRRLKKRLRERSKREVRSTRHWIFPECSVIDACETLAMGTMQADAFWKNYEVAQEWQKRHSITWWRSRCIALEHENKILRDKVRFLAKYRGYQDTQEYDCRAENNSNDESNTRVDDNAGLETNNEDLEFNVTEDVLNFFETSERHKRELREKRKFNIAAEENILEGTTSFVSAAERARVRKEEADLLYGEAGSKILAMETALQSTVERYEDSANSQYWPNIPLNLTTT